MNHHLHDGNAEQHNFWGDTHSLPFDTDMPWCKADMVLGDARSMCRGTGICKISVQRVRRSPTGCSCDTVPIFLAKVNDWCLLLAIDKRQVDFVQQCKHLLSGHLALSKSIALPSSLSKQLGWKVAVYVQPRHYPLFQDKHYYHCYLNAKL